MLVESFGCDYVTLFLHRKRMKQSLFKNKFKQWSELDIQHTALKSHVQNCLNLQAENSRELFLFYLFYKGIFYI